MNQYKRQNIEFLKRRVEELKKKLLEFVQLWYYYQNDVYQEIMFKYDSIFGELEDEIDSKIQTSRELEKKVEFLRMKLSRGGSMEENSMKFIDVLVDRQVRRSASRPTVQNGKVAQPQSKEKVAESVRKLKCEVNDNYEIPVLYRNLVKKLHPDVSGESDDFHQFWNNVQDAYRSRDIDSLRVLNLTLCYDIENEEKENKNLETKLKTLLLELEQNIRRHEAKLNNLRFQEPFNFKDKLDNKMWVASRKNQLQNRIVQIDRKIKHHNYLLTALSDSLTERDRKRQSSAMTA